MFSLGAPVIANLAQAQQTPKARKEVERLLALEPGQTMASISTWADEHRNPNSAVWHYVNFPRDSCTYDAERDGPDGRCVVDAIELQLEVLASSAPHEKRLTAPKYVIHLVADVHQPLHAGYRDDKGGNTYQLQAFMRGSNLHALWDSGLIRSMNEALESLTERLRRLTLPNLNRDLNVVHVAEESCRIVALPGFYPQCLVGLDYIERFAPTLEQRLVLAGARLAGLTN